MIIIGVVIMLVIGVGLEKRRVSPDQRPINPHPVATANRRSLRICPGKSLLDRGDLVRIARTYKVLRREQPVIADILDLNKECRPSPQVEALDLDRSPCSANQDDAPCETGIVLVPLR